MMNKSLLKSLFTHVGWGEIKKQIETEINKIEEIILDKDSSPTIEDVDKARNKREAYLFVLNIENEIKDDTIEMDYSDSV